MSAIVTCQALGNTFRNYRFSGHYIRPFLYKKYLFPPTTSYNVQFTRREIFLWQLILQLHALEYSGLCDILIIVCKYKNYTFKIFIYFSLLDITAGPFNIIWTGRKLYGLPCFKIKNVMSQCQKLCMFSLFFHMDVPMSNISISKVWSIK